MSLCCGMEWALTRQRVTAPEPVWAGVVSVRVKLTLSYAGFLVVAGMALFAVGFFLLRYIPEGNLWLVDGGHVPSRGDLLEVFVRYVWWAIGGLVAFGLVGGWLDRKSTRLNSSH